MMGKIDFIIYNNFMSCISNVCVYSNYCIFHTKEMLSMELATINFGGGVGFGALLLGLPWILRFPSQD